MTLKNNKLSAKLFKAINQSYILNLHKLFQKKTYFKQYLSNPVN